MGKGFTVINADEVIRLKTRLREINKLNIDEVMFVDDQGLKIEIPQEDLETWKFSGLNISDYVMYKIQK